MTLLPDAKSYFDELATEEFMRQPAAGEADLAAGRAEDLEDIFLRKGGVFGKHVRAARLV